MVKIIFVMSLNVCIFWFTNYTQNTNLLSAKQMSVAGDYGIHRNFIAVDVYGNVYSTEPFSCTASFNHGTETHNLTTSGKPDIFICKLDASGNFVWPKRIGGAGKSIAYSIHSFLLYYLHSDNR